MFESVTLRGTQGDIVWAYHKAIELSAWQITRAVATTAAKGPPKGKAIAPKRVTKEWILTGIVARVDGFTARQRPLLFTAPRDKGRWCFEVRELTVGERRLTATLGQPLY